MSEQVDIYTDGACRGNPGPGGWAAILRYRDNETLIHGAEAETTNNRMELQAAVSALQKLKRPCRVRITTDSRYLMEFNIGYQIGNKMVGKPLQKNL